MKRIVTLICLITALTPIYGQESAKKTEVEVSTSYEVLSKNLGTWQSYSLNVRHDFSARQVLYGSYKKAYRSTAQNDSLTVGFYQPLSKKHTLLLEMSTSPESKFLPKWTGLAQLETRIMPATFLQTGYRRTVYRDAKINIINAGIEKYWKSYRFNYGAVVAAPDTGGVTVSHRLRVDKYYGKNASSFGAEFGIGNEIASFFPDARVQKSNIASFGVGGKHWFNSKFGIRYRANFDQQGSFYNRQGVTIGAIYRF